MYRKVLTTFILNCLAVSLAGCGGDRPPLVEASGKVEFQGQPVTAGSIQFFRVDSTDEEDPRVSSLLQTDGSFTMKTFPYGDGVSPGEYTAALAPELASRIGKPKYASPKETPWKITVPDSGVQNHIFEVK